MVTDDAAGLKVGIDRDCSNILEAPFFKIFTDPVGKAVAHRDRPFLMALIENRFSSGISPDVIAEASELLPHFLIAPGVIDHCLYLAG